MCQVHASFRNPSAPRMCTSITTTKTSTCPRPTRRIFEDRNRMSHKKYVATGMLISLFTVTAVAAADGPPDFAPNASVGWVSAGVRLLPPPSGPGPVGPARGRPLISNNEVRERGAQALFPMGDLDAPILQPWAREKLRERNERVLAGKPGFSLQASCWPAGVPGFLLYAVQPVYF